MSDPKNVPPPAAPQRSRFFHTLLEFAPSQDPKRQRKYVSIWRRDIGVLSPEDVASRKRMRTTIALALLAVCVCALTFGYLITR